MMKNEMNSKAQKNVQWKGNTLIGKKSIRNIFILQYRLKSILTLF